MAFNATFNNISAISWLSVLLVTIIRAGAQNTQINYVKLESNVNNTTIIKTTKLNMRTIITVINVYANSLDYNYTNILQSLLFARFTE
jgi:hypothetical protein